jgi:hypothetical protein
MARKSPDEQTLESSKLHFISWDYTFKDKSWGINWSYKHFNLNKSISVYMLSWQKTE